MATNEEDRGARAATYDLPAGPHKYLANAGYTTDPGSAGYTYDLERRVAALEQQIKELRAQMPPAAQHQGSARQASTESTRAHAEQHGRLPLQSGLNAPAASTREGT